MERSMFVSLGSPAQILRLRSKFALLPLLLLAITMVGLSSATSARAGIDGYQCGLMNPYTWCQNGVARNFFYNESHETYAGNILSCVKEIRQSNGSEYSRACGYTTVSHSFPQCNCGGLYPLMSMESPAGPRQLYGVAYY